MSVARMVFTIHSVERMNNTRDGGPRFKLHTSEGDFRTTGGSQMDYDLVSNFTSARLSTYILGTPVRATISRAGIVSHLELPDGDKISDMRFYVVGDSGRMTGPFDHDYQAEDTRNWLSSRRPNKTFHIERHTPASVRRNFGR